MKTYLCWHLPDGSAERGEEVRAESLEDAAEAFGNVFFDDNQGEWLGGDVMVQELDVRLEAVGEPVRFDVDVSLSDLSITADRKT